MAQAATIAQESPAVAPAMHRAARYVGEVVYLFAFDIAYDMVRRPIREVMGQPMAEFSVDTNKRNPRHLLLHRPQMARLAPIERLGPHGPVRVERAVKVFPVGAISITIRVPFAVNHIEDLVVYHDLNFNNGNLNSEVRELAEELRRELAPYCLRPVRKLEEEEAYTVFCVETPLLDANGQRVVTEKWFNSHRRQVAALLTQEPNQRDLSDQEAHESTGRYLSYYENDLVVVDWDAALIIDEPQDFTETLYIMELANFQLAELEAYDRLLDDALERSYRDVASQPVHGRHDVLRHLREIRVDLARVSDELSNITKFFGDWHLARIYQAISSRFHLGDWHRTIDGKLKTLDDLYHLLNQDRNNFYMLVLECSIVLLFIIDLIILVMGMQK